MASAFKSMFKGLPIILHDPINQPVYKTWRFIQFEVIRAFPNLGTS